MENSLWEIITCHTPIIENALNLVEPGSDEARKLGEWGELFEIPKDKGLSAMAIMQYVCNILLEFPQFELGPASDTSAGMLMKYNDDEFPLENGIVYEILYPNLYCVLALDAIGQRCPAEPPKTLTALLGLSCDEKTKLIEASRFLSKYFPEELKNLFRVVKSNGANKNPPYEINTQFPALLSAILKHARTSPLSAKESTANSIILSKRFYDTCIDAIAPNGIWSKRSFAEYYLFERVFRLNAKFTLFWAEYNTSQKNKTALSPKILSDFFFHSPLVLFPQIAQHRKPSLGKGKLLFLFYNQHADYKKQTEFLHFLIQLSSYWFPIVLSILRDYMKYHNITSFSDVERFFFPENQNEIEFSSFQQTYTPATTEFPDGGSEQESPGNRQTKRKLPRPLTDAYSQNWSAFRPCFDHHSKAFAPKSLADWRDEAIPEHATAADHYAMNEIKQTLY